MKRFVSIKSKLIYLLLATILLSLLLVGISLDLLIKRFYQNESNKSFSRLFDEVAEQLLERENAVVIHANRLSLRNDIVSTVNMIHQYATPGDYQPLIYDGEKRKLASELRKEAKAGAIDEIAIYDAGGTLVSYYSGRGGAELMGYVSYEQGQPVSYSSSDTPINPWLRALPPTTLPQQLRPEDVPGRGIRYRRFSGGIILETYAPVARVYPDGSSVVVGHVSVKQCITQAFVELLTKKTGVEFAIIIDDRLRLGKLDAIAIERIGKPAAIRQVSQGIPITRIDLERYFAAASALPLDDNSLVTLIAAVPKEEVGAAIDNTRAVVLLVLLMGATIILPLGVLAANRTISRPLAKLADGVHAVRKGEYDARVSVPSNDELNALAEGFNSMSTAIQQRETQLLQSENKYRNLVDNLPQSIFFKDRNYVYISCNRRFAEVLGLTPQEIVGKSDFDLYSTSYANKYRLDDERIMNSGIMEELEESYEVDNSHGVIQTVKTPIRASDGQVIGILGIFWDITEKKQAEKQLLQSAAVFESTADGVIVADADSKIIAVNKAFSEISGYSEAEAVGQRPSFRRSERQDKHFYRAMWDAIRRDGRWQGEIWNRRKSGEVYPEWMTISIVRDDEGNIGNYVAVFSDITNIKRSQMQLDHMAHHDPLTDLPNRTLLDDRLSQLINRARRHNSNIGVLFIDLDRFKNVNDTLGHPTGDILLQDVARRLQGLLRGQDTVARLGGDEFIILIEDMGKPEVAEAVAAKVIDTLSRPFTVQSQELYIGASIGISIFPDDGDDAATLIKHADAAMYRAKEQGRNTYQFYTRELTRSAMERLELESALRRALDRNQLELYYQPQVNLSSGAIIGAEALLRWHHPDLGMVPPDKFIPLAEESGLITGIGEWVLASACRQASEWMGRCDCFHRIAVNLSGVQVQRGDIVDKVRRILNQTGLPAHMLELEITESVLMQYPEIAAQTLGGLREIGIELAIDDFGTGYSSLSYLKRFPIQILKIDRSFVMDVPHDANDTAITRAVIALGKSLQLKLIAEGVETEEQERFLTREGCDIGQGYYYSRPLPAAEFAALMEQGGCVVKKPAKA